MIPLKLAPAIYESPISLPEGEAGALRLTHHTLQGETPVVGFRQAYCRGIRAVKGILSKPRRIHELSEVGRGTWMTDLPEELFQIAEALTTVKPAGRVLVGGLGLGILAQALLRRSSVESVTVVELSADVITLCARPGYVVVQDDLLGFLTRSRRAFDCYLLDTWQATSEMTWWHHLVPLRRAIRHRWGAKPKVWGWAEDIMRGQVAASIAGGNRLWKYEGLPERMRSVAIRDFLEGVGLPWWEKKYAVLADRSAEETVDA